MWEAESTGRRQQNTTMMSEAVTVSKPAKEEGGRKLEFKRVNSKERLSKATRIERERVRKENYAKLSHN